MIRSVFLAAGLLATGPAGHRIQGPVLLSHVTVIDGRGGAPQPDQDVLLDRGRIAAIGRTGSLSPPATVRILDLTGRFLIPGLIDTHLHSPPDSARVAAGLAYLFRNGITSARDMAGDAVVLGRVAAAARPASVPMAQLHYVAFWAGPTFYQADRRPTGSTQGKAPGTVPWFQAIDDTSDFDRLAGEAAALGVHSLKLYSDIPPGRLRDAVAAAHRRGLRAASHVAVFPAPPREVIASGVDAVAHAALLVWEGTDTLPGRFHTTPHTNFGPVGPYAAVPPDHPRIVAVLADMARRRIVLDATVSAIARGISPEASEWSLRVTALARRLGVAISTGTDRPEEPSLERKPALFDEIELLVRQAGFSPLDAITAATWHGAMAIGVAKDLGTVEPGKIADLVVLGGNPARDISNLRRAVMVIKGGVVHHVGSPD